MLRKIVTRQCPLHSHNTILVPFFIQGKAWIFGCDTYSSSSSYYTVNYTMTLPVTFSLCESGFETISILHFIIWNLHSGLWWGPHNSERSKAI